MKNKPTRKEVMKRLTEYCETTGKMDRIDKIEWLLDNYPDTFLSAQAANQWLDDLWGAR